jgi:hypothetical protein
MELYNKNKKYTSLSVKWDEKDGFTTKIDKPTNLLTNNDINRIVKVGIPSGSNWAKYNEFRSIKIWQDMLNFKNYIFISFSIVENVNTKEEVLKTVPQSKIYILDEDEIDGLVSIGFANFINLIYHNNEKVYNNLNMQNIGTIGVGQKHSLITLKTEVIMKRSESWKYIELALLKEFIEKWPYFRSFSTLTTLQDNFDKFQKNCMLEEDIKELKRKDYLVFYLDKGLSLHSIKNEKINIIFDNLLNSLKYEFKISIWQSIIISIIPLLLYFLLKILLNF